MHMRLVVRDSSTLEVVSPITGETTEWKSNSARTWLTLAKDILRVGQASLPTNGDSMMRVELTEEATAALQAGHAHWKAFKDGSGFLPTLVGSDEKFVSQVRLVPENLSAHLPQLLCELSTQAALATMIAQLDLAVKKLDLVLENQRAEWVAKVETGLRQFQGFQLEPVPGVLLQAADKLEEGVFLGLRQYENRLMAFPPRKVSLLRSLLDGVSTAFSREDPVKRETDLLDAEIDDTRLLATGAAALAIALVALGQPERSSQVRREMFANLSRLTEASAKRESLAAYSAPRRAFAESASTRLSECAKLPQQRLTIDCPIALLEAENG